MSLESAGSYGQVGSEPEVIHVGVVQGNRFPGTYLRVRVHGRRAVLSCVTVAGLWPQFSEAPCSFIAVLPGWTLADYLYCMNLCRAAGMDLSAAPVAGLGSVCRRQPAYGDTHYGR